MQCVKMIQHNIPKCLYWYVYFHFIKMNLTKTSWIVSLLEDVLIKWFQYMVIKLNFSTIHGRPKKHNVYYWHTNVRWQFKVWDFFQWYDFFYTDFRWRLYNYCGDNFQIVNWIFVNITNWIKGCSFLVMTCPRFTCLTICLTSTNGNIKQTSSAMYKLSTYKIIYCC